MQKNLIHSILFIFFVLFSIDGYSSSQDSIRMATLKDKLNRIANENVLYQEKLDISVSSMPIGELLRNIAKASEVNINVESDAGKRITCNFKQVAIIDMIFFICKEYGFEVELIGGILSIYPYKALPAEPIIQMNYFPEDNTLSYDFTGAKLIQVARKIAEKSGVNIVVPQLLFERPVSAYGNQMNIDNAIQSIAGTNQLTAQKKDEKTWSIVEEESGGKAMPTRQQIFRMNELRIDSLRRITTKVSNTPIQSLVLDACQQLNINYFFVDQLDQSTGISVEQVDFDSFLKILFTGTNFTWRVEGGVYIFGKMNDSKILSTVHVHPMKYRTVDKVADIIPIELRQGVEIITYPDLNSLVISGGQRNIMQIVTYLNDIDRSIPLISIDVIIVDVTETTSREAGISMGLGTEPATTYGSLSPGIDFSLGANSVNKLINSFNGFGSINLGKVSPNFYMSLKLLEEDGKIFLRSTPRLSTLNGHKAILKSGEMRYYKESQINIIGTQNPLQSEAYQWKPVEANLLLDITPFVSLDSCITMQIELTQSEFTDREADDAPPGTTTRSFNSIIKVRDQEMVLLGGIERNLTSRTSKGLPFIARIPVLRWIFGTSSKRKSVQKLNVFIKPTIIE